MASHVTAHTVVVGGDHRSDTRAELTVHGDLTVTGGYVAGRDIHIVESSPMTPPSPRLLPRDATDFVNRADELAEAARLADAEGPTPVIVFTGSAGVGKTALAVRLCHSLAGSRPDGALFTDLGGFGGRERRTSDVLAEFLLALGLPAQRIPAGFDDRRNQFRTMTADARLVVLIDNASEETQVRDLVPSGPSAAVVVTSRSRLAGLSGARVLEVRGLREDAATRLLRIVAYQVSDAPPEALAQIAAHCAGLPLALVIAGARMNVLTHSAGERMAEMLGDERRRLNWLSAGDLAVRTSFRTSYRHLPDEEQQAFRLLSRVGEGCFAAWHLARLAEVDIDRADSILTRLHDLNLVRTASVSDGCDHILYEFHDLIRDFADELYDGEGPSNAPDRRLLRAYRLVTEAVGRALAPRSDGGAGGVAVDLAPGRLLIHDHLAWCAAEHANVLVMVRRASEAGDWEDVVALGSALMPFFQTRCMWATAEECYALAGSAADHAGDTAAKAELLLAVAGVRRSQARWAEAVEALEECLALHDGLPPGKEVAYALGGIGVALRNEGSWESAWRCFQESRQILDAEHDPWGTAFAVRGLGTVRQGQERWDEAHQFLSEAAELFRSAGDSGREAMALVRVGAVLRGLGRPDEALAVLGRVAPVFADRQNSSWVAITAVHQSACWSDLGDQARADALLDLAEPVFADLGDERWQAIAHLHRGVSRRKAGSHAEAGTCLDLAAEGFDALGDRPGIAGVLYERGLLLRETGDEHGAVTALEAAQTAFQALGSRRAERIARLLMPDQAP
ncbi:ATP-binding protein [Streptomyces sp. NPDC059446]|uniref:ATP-binding protein n=1 Tax=Streptomyces sp. NPDC059446 TaxID=3346833 RepID=UPI0036925B55